MCGFGRLTKRPQGQMDKPGPIRTTPGERDNPSAHCGIGNLSDREVCRQAGQRQARKNTDAKSGGHKTERSMMVIEPGNVAGREPCTQAGLGNDPTCWTVIDVMVNPVLVPKVDHVYYPVLGQAVFQGQDQPHLLVAENVSLVSVNMQRIGVERLISDINVSARRSGGPLEFSDTDLNNGCRSSRLQNTDHTGHPCLCDRGKTREGYSFCPALAQIEHCPFEPFKVGQGVGAFLCEVKSCWCGIDAAATLFKEYKPGLPGQHA